jgi:hypothetical protein
MNTERDLPVPLFSDVLIQEKRRNGGPRAAWRR